MIAIADTTAPPGIVLDPLVREPVVVLIGVGLLLLTFAVYRRTAGELAAARRATLLLLRLAGIALVLLLLLQPSRIELLPPPTTERVVLVGIDTSRSMRQSDMERGTRLDAAKKLLSTAGIVGADGRVADARIRLFQFSGAATNVGGSVFDLAPDGTTTRLHQPVTEMLAAVGEGEVAAALVLLTDGHDFELVNPSRTAAAARGRNVPLYAVPFGRQGRVRDVAARIQSFQPYTYVKQQARIAVALRLIGCEFEEIQVQLLRQGVPVQTRRVNADELPEATVEFEVTEPEIGQVEYEARALPLEGEVDTNNNQALTYLNVIDQQIQVLLLEGSPYWDTTFLQRSLMRNDKFEVDALTKYGAAKVRPLRKRAVTNDLPELLVPTTVEGFGRYDVVILGRGLEEMMTSIQLRALEQYVQEHSGAVIFARGPAFSGPLARNELEPVLWSDVKRERVKLQVARAGATAGPFRSLAGEGGGVDALPELIGGRDATESKPLTATLATAGEAAAAQDSASGPAGMVHRRLGSGQVVSVGVEGVWRWGLHPKVEEVNTAFDRFWDQMLLWLLASRDFVPAKQFSFRPSTANVQLGEKVHFRLGMRRFDAAVRQVPLRIYSGSNEVARLSFAPSANDTTRLTTEFLPPRTGRYRAVAQFPDGTTQEARFIAFTDNPEETEVATDVALLKRLCTASGGRLLAPAELETVVREAKEEPRDTTPKTKLTSLWDRAWVFYAIGAVFAAEWFLRRRWGLS